ncbi:hypothetical protein TL16_g03037 [Triparma laevis f. inornata]|uniref:tRNA-dihydrouridine(47) synthase [NAD(P)(+)] n=1 Tax=Triparma laevis f. inornata TaxID=1714386 RepID=A0A9W7DXR5_9STRA|nr:hypothetical protein TL16_g03037 [Triparma laevis f. inornata]
MAACYKAPTVAARTMDAIKQTNPTMQVLVKPGHEATEVPDVLTPRVAPDTTGVDDRDKKKNKGQNKKRPRDAKCTEVGKSLCLGLIRNNKCPWDDCKFSHDIEAVVVARPQDVGETCVIFEKFGSCPFGVNCRWGSTHINPITGANLFKTGAPPADYDMGVKNGFSIKTQKALRSRKYPFFYERNTPPDQFTPTLTLWGGQILPKPPVVAPLNVSKRDPDDVIEAQTKAYEERMAVAKKVRKCFEERTTTEYEQTLLEFEKKKTEAIASSNTPFPKKTKSLIDFENKVYIAPLTTVGNLPFRRIMKKYGADITCSEMALCANLLQGQASELALLKRHEDEDVFGVQLAGGHPDQFSRCAELIEKEDLEVDFIDMNCGCPLDLVCDKGGGSAMMQKANKLKAAVIGIGNVFSGPVTIKMRTGWDEKKPFAVKLCRQIQGWGLPNVAAVMVHGRSRTQRYSRLADYDYIGQVGASMDRGAKEDMARRIPLIPNGDVMSFVDFEERKRAGVSNTAMLARGALIKPWLPTEIKERRHWDISASERLDIMRDFVNFGLEQWGSDKQGINTTRRFLLEWQR